MTTVFTNGCFDLLHPGHVHLLLEAKKLGDWLVVGLNSDASVARLKPGRPIMKQDDRWYLLRALRCVDEVRIFDEDTPEKLIRMVKPDVLVKGSDWEGKTVAGADFVRERGGFVKFIGGLYIPFSQAEKYSTTGIIERCVGAWRKDPANREIE